MKVKTIATALVLSLAAVGVAQAATPRGDTDNQPFQGVYGQSEANSATRAQVVAQLQQAHAAGLTGNGDTDNAPFVAVKDGGAAVTPQATARVDDPHAVADVAFGDIDNQPFQG